MWRGLTDAESSANIHSKEVFPATAIISGWFIVGANIGGMARMEV
jgi:hypothetical protein